MILSGLYPNNPLSFLATLGIIRIMDRIEPESELELCWNDNACIKRSVGEEPSQEELSGMLTKYLSKDDPMFDQPYQKNLEEFKKFKKFVLAKTDINESVNNDLDIRRIYDFFACLAFQNKNKKKEKKDIIDTTFRFITGKATLFNNAKKLTKEIKKDKKHVYNTLFKEWNYSDKGISMDWDPISCQREHAKAISEPSGSFNPSMYAANRLALEAISLYPTVQTNNYVDTVGWYKKKFVWPIWKEFAGLDEIRGIISMDYSKFKKAEIDRIGIMLYASEKITLSSGKHFRFTPASMINPEDILK